MWSDGNGDYIYDEEKRRRKITQHPTNDKNMKSHMLIQRKFYDPEIGGEATLRWLQLGEGMSQWVQFAVPIHASVTFDEAKNDSLVTQDSCARVIRATNSLFYVKLNILFLEPAYLKVE